MKKIERKLMSKMLKKIYGKINKKKSFLNKKFRVAYIYIGRITNYCETYKKLL